MHKCSCVKCKKEYSSEEPDDYFCLECLKTHRQVIEETEKKLANKPRKEVISDLRHYDSCAKHKGFVNAKDLGL
ncbi:MAG: hypothetical protein KKF54_08180 [Candidatus Omnitrophica bacterium]|nr:hypothetical protein [Candidatus Omnitrophota bacterium]